MCDGRVCTAAGWVGALPVGVLVRVGARQTSPPSPAGNIATVPHLTLPSAQSGWRLLQLPLPAQQPGQHLLLLNRRSQPSKSVLSKSVIYLLNKIYINRLICRVLSSSVRGLASLDCVMFRNSGCQTENEAAEAEDQTGISLIRHAILISTPAGRREGFYLSGLY